MKFYAGVGTRVNQPLAPIENIELACQNKGPLLSMYGSKLWVISQLGLLAFWPNEQIGRLHPCDVLYFAYKTCKHKKNVHKNIQAYT